MQLRICIFLVILLQLYYTQFAVLKTPFTGLTDVTGLIGLLTDSPNMELLRLLKQRYISEPSFRFSAYVKSLSATHPYKLPAACFVFQRNT